MRYADLLAEKRRKEAERIKAEQLSVTQQPVYQSYQPPKSNNQVAYVAEKALLGLTAAAEGLYDFTVGGVASLLGRKDIAEEVYKDDITGQYAQLIEDKYNPTKVAYGIGMVVETLANMAPSIAVNAVLPGAGLATIGTQAAGRGVTQAYQQTGELGAKEWGYGILSGASEAAIEKISGGIGGLGKGAVDDVAKKLVKNSVIRGMIGEGLEEVASTALDPYLQRITYNPNAKNAELGEYNQSFILGAITSGILQGGQNTIRNLTTHRSTGNKIIEQNKTQEVIDKALMLNKGDAFNMAKTLKSRVEQNKEITPVAIGRLAMQYNADFAEVNIRDIQESENVSRKQAEKIYSESLIAENQNPVIEKAVAEGKISRRTVKQIAEFAKSTKAEIEYINETSDIEGYYKDGKLHINVNRGDVAYKTAVHEQLHYLEKNNPEQYKQVKEAVLGLSESIPEIKSKIAEVRNTYKNAKINGKALNLSETEIDSEVVAKVATDLIKSPDMLNKAIKNNKTFVERITGFIKGLLERGKGLFSTTEQKQLERAYNALTEALKAEKAVSAENAQNKSKYSLADSDNQGKKLTKAQQEFFKDSKVRDEQGRLLVVYHGTTANEFTVFNKDYVGSRFLNDEVGFFFTNSESVAKDYTTSYWNRNNSKRGHLFETYLNFEKPLIVRASMDSDINGDAIVHYDLHNTELVEKAMEGGYDGIIVKSRQRDIADLYVAFEPEQIKLTTNLNPTTNEDIRYSLTETKVVKNTKSTYPMTGIEINKAVREAVARQKSYDKMSANIAYKARTLKEYIKGEYLDASFMPDEVIKQYAKLLKGVEYAGKLKNNPQTVRKAIVQLDKHYTKDAINRNGEFDYYNPIVREDINLIVDRYNKLESGKNISKKFTTKELQAIDRITSHIKHLYTNYNTSFFKGKSLKTSEVAQNGITQSKKVKPLNAVQSSSFVKAVLNPADYFAMTDGYQSGIASDFFNELQSAKDKQIQYKKTAGEMFNPFFKANPKYQDSLRQDMGNGLTKGQALALYLTYNRPHGKKYLSLENAEIQVANDVQSKKGNYKEAIAQSKYIKFTDELLPQLTESDMQFIKLVQNYFQWSGEQISLIEFQKWGVVNPKEANYFPISISGNDIFSVLSKPSGDNFSLARPSFTYQTTEVSQKSLFIGNIIDIIYNQINQASAFVGYSIPVQEIAKIYNTKVDGKNLKRQISEINKDFDDYLRNYLQDIQGIRQSMDGVDRAFGKFRAWYGRAALGLNPKVWFNQLTSIPMAKSVGIGYGNQAKGVAKTIKLLANKTQFTQEYNRLVELAPEVWQRYEGSIAVKEALGIQSQSKFDKVMDYTTAPIQSFDKFAIMSLWEACKIQNSDINSAVAQFKQVLQKTQPNYEASNRSEIMRSKNQITRMFTMFQTQPLQNLSRLFTAFNKFIVAKQTNNAKLIAEATPQLKATLSAFVVQTMSFVLVAQLFKSLLGTKRRDKDNEEISLTADLMRDIGGTVTGMFPIARDVYSYFTTGYEPTNAAYAGFSNLVKSAENFYKSIEMLFDEEETDTTKINKAFRNIMLDLTQTFGIPLRNVERYTVGIINNFDPELALKYNSLFYKQKYTSMLDEAIAKNNDKEAISILKNTLYDKGLSNNIDSKVYDEILRLYKGGQSVLPSTASSTFNYDGKQFNLTKSQFNSFKTIYAQANNDVSTLIQSKNYNNLSDAEKAKAINNVYEYYYNKGKIAALGKTNPSFAIYEVIGVNNYAAVMAFNSYATADKDKNGNSISGSKKTKVLKHIAGLDITTNQKLLLIMAIGYTIQDGEIKGYSAQRAKLTVAKYIASLKISKEEKIALAEQCGFTVVNGKIRLQ